MLLGLLGETVPVAGRQTVPEGLPAVMPLVGLLVMWMAAVKIPQGLLVM